MKRDEEDTAFDHELHELKTQLEAGTTVEELSPLPGRRRPQSICRSGIMAAR